LISVRNWDDPVFEGENGGSRADKRRQKRRDKRGGAGAAPADAVDADA
jgi:hypothetical protein